MFLNDNGDFKKIQWFSYYIFNWVNDSSKCLKIWYHELFILK